MTDTDTLRGIRYADGGAQWAPVFWPDPEKIRQINLEWEKVSNENQGTATPTDNEHH